MGFFDYRDSVHSALKDDKEKKERKDHPKNETIAQHLKHCKAKNCPFMRFVDIDKVDASAGPSEKTPQLVTAVENGTAKTVEVNPSKPIGSTVFEKLAAAMSDMWKYADELDAEKEDESIVKRVIESGLTAMHEELDENDCVTKTDDDAAKVVIVPPGTK